MPRNRLAAIALLILSAGVSAPVLAQKPPDSVPKPQDPAALIAAQREGMAPLA